MLIKDELEWVIKKLREEKSIDIEDPFQAGKSEGLLIAINEIKALIYKLEKK